jgi:hypothetical protein
MSVALVIEHAKRLRRVLCYLRPLWLHHIFRYYLINDTIFGRKKLICIQNVGFDFLYNFYLKYLSL